MLIITIVILLLYLLLIGSFTFGFDKVKTIPLEDLKAKIEFSIVIPFRNEANFLPDLLDSILELNYDKHKFEILFIDDHSEDNSVELIRRKLNKTQIDFRILTNENPSASPKKEAITKAISQSKYDEYPQYEDPPTHHFYPINHKALNSSQAQRHPENKL